MQRSTKLTVLSVIFLLFVLPILFFLLAYIFRGDAAIDRPRLLEEFAKSLIALLLIILSGLRDEVRELITLSRRKRECRQGLAKRISRLVPHLEEVLRFNWIDDQARISLPFNEAELADNRNNSLLIRLNQIVDETNGLISWCQQFPPSFDPVTGRMTEKLQSLVNKANIFEGEKTSSAWGSFKDAAAEMIHISSDGEEITC